MRTPYLRQIIADMLEGLLKLTVDSTVGVPTDAGQDRSPASGPGEWQLAHKGQPASVTDSVGHPSGVRFLLQGRRANLRWERHVDEAMQRERAVTRIQTGYRSGRARRRRRAVSCQCAWRGYVARRIVLVRRRRRSAGTIQRVVRGSVGRTLAGQRRAWRAACRIQSAWHMKRARVVARLACRARAAAVAQAVVRRRLALVQARHAEARDVASCAIQRWWATVRTQRLLPRRAAVVALQTATRGMLGRRRAQRARLEKSVSLLVRSIQARFRGAVARQTQQRRRFAARVLQSGWRRYRAWRCQVAVRNMLRIGLRHLSYRALRHWNAAARSIARSHRRACRAKKRQVALFLQCLFRGRRARLELIRAGRAVAALSIQGAWGRYRARRRLRWRIARQTKHRMAEEQLRRAAGRLLAARVGSSPERRVSVWGGVWGAPRQEKQPPAQVHRVHLVAPAVVAPPPTPRPLSRHKYRRMLHPRPAVPEARAVGVRPSKPTRSSADSARAGSGLASAPSISRNRVLTISNGAAHLSW